MFRGNAFARALTSYWAAKPGSDRQLPGALADPPASADGTPPAVSTRVFSYAPVQPASAPPSADAASSSPQRIGSPPPPSP